VRVPLDLTDPSAIAVLGAIITITPGTVTAALSGDRRYLTVHGLDVEDADTLVRSIKQRYERPLREIFEC
jgi:multicomponent K+:H+ antiporter subunit E